MTKEGLAWVDQEYRKWMIKGILNSSEGRQFTKEQLEPVDTQVLEFIYDNRGKATMNMVK